MIFLPSSVSTWFLLPISWIPRYSCFKTCTSILFSFHEVFHKTYSSGAQDQYNLTLFQQHLRTPQIVRCKTYFLHICFFILQKNLGFMFTLIAITRELPNHVRFFILTLTLPWVFHRCFCIIPLLWIPNNVLQIHLVILIFFGSSTKSIANVKEINSISYHPIQNISTLYGLLVRVGPIEPRVSKITDTEYPPPFT